MTYQYSINFHIDTLYVIIDSKKNLKERDNSSMAIIKHHLFGKKEKEYNPYPEGEPIIKVSRIIKPGNVNTLSALIGATKALAAGDFEKAEKYCNNALMYEGDLPQAYLGKLMVELKLKTEDEFYTLTKPFDYSENYKKIMKLEDKILAKELKNVNNYIKKNKK